MAVSPRLTSTEIEAALERLPNWTGDEHGLRRRLVFEEFRGVIDFMHACVDEIERRNHHPVWTNKYNSLDITLNTFDVGNRVTSHDVELARFLDSVLTESGVRFRFMSEE
jgi:4a-hydroxytetrahydrobiopterin dehydratase